MFRPELLTENRISFTQLARKEGIAIATVWRWAQNGVRSVRLESFMIGGRKFTTLEAFERFVASSNGGSLKQTSSYSKERLRAIERAEAELGE